MTPKQTKSKAALIDLNQTIGMFGEDPGHDLLNDQQREVRMAEAIAEVKVKKIQKKERIIDNYF